MSTEPHQLYKVHQDPATCIITMADGTAVIFEDDGTITVNVPYDPAREPAHTTPPEYTPSGRYGPGGTRFTIERKPLDAEEDR